MFENTKIKPRIISLCSNNSLISAIANDINYNSIFKKQLSNKIIRIQTYNQVLHLVLRRNNNKFKKMINNILLYHKSKIQHKIWEIMMIALNILFLFFFLHLHLYHSKHSLIFKKEQCCFFIPLKILMIDLTVTNLFSFNVYAIRSIFFDYYMNFI